MKYMCVLNGKKYEVLIEKMDDFAPLTREQAMAAPVAAAPVTPAAPSAPAAPAMAKPAPTTSAVTAASEGSETIIAPMPGKILDICVTIGQTVAVGDVVLTMEAMKMENEMVTSKGGTISKICVKTGDTVETDDILIIID